jgi:hypothetical protein
MALAYGNFDLLNNQLQFLLFEIGIGLSTQQLDRHIIKAHKEIFKSIQQEIEQECLSSKVITSHHIHDYLTQLNLFLKKQNPAWNFIPWKKIHHQIDESIANLALAQAYKSSWNARLKKELHHHPNLWSWIKQQLDPHQALFFLEQWGAAPTTNPLANTAHRYNRREFLRYSPQCQAQFHIHWGAINKDNRLISYIEGDFNQLMKQEFPQEYQQWHSRLNLMHLNAEEFYPVPIHPWDWRARLQNEYNSLIDNKTFVLLPHHQKVVPTMSPDYLMTRHNIGPLMQLNAQKNTFATQKILALLKTHGSFNNTLFIEQGLSRLTLGSQHTNTSTSIRIINNESVLEKKESLTIPLQSLFAFSPLSNTPLLQEIIQASGLEPSQYFAHYCEVVLAAPLSLLLQYKTSFTTQSHNIHILFQENRPCKVILRDIDEFSIQDRSSNCAHAERPSRHIFIEFVFKNNLMLWINCLHQQYKIQKEHLWTIVRHSIEKLFNDKIKVKKADSEAQKQITSLLQDPWQHTCTFSMQLQPRTDQIMYSPLMNPLTDKLD